MSEHTVVPVETTNGTELQFSEVFNTAVPFIDRHLDEGRAGKVAIYTEEIRVSYFELRMWVNRCGNGLLGLGMKPGDRLLMIVKDCAEFVYLFWGAIKAGIVPVPVNTLLRANDFHYLIADSGATGLAYSPEYASEVTPALAACEQPPAHVIRTGYDKEGFFERFIGESAELEAVPARPDDDGFWLYSSGSTGRPKAAVHRHRDLAVTAHHYGVETLGIRENDTCFSAAKLFFAYGLGNSMTFPLWVGGASVLAAGRPTPELTFAMIERFYPTLFFGVPTLYASQLEALKTATPKLDTLRLCVSAGEALPADIYRRWKEKTGLDILDGIGSTEALHIFISNRLGEIKPGTSGKPVPGYEARIRADNGAEAAPGQPGRLVIRGRSTARAYWNNPEKTAATMVGDWLDTGDTYVVDDEGYFVYCGRSDDMIKVGGIWCSPFEIEARLVEHPAVVEAAVAGRSDENGLVKPEAWIVLAAGAAAGPALEQQLLEHCKAALAPYKYPRRFHLVTALPKTATGKIQRFRLREGT